MKINLFYLSLNPYGGWVTYTYHLIHALRQAGADVTLYKIPDSNNSEHFPRDFGYGIEYMNISLAEAKKLRGKNLIVALAKQRHEAAIELLKSKRCHIVIHDPAELVNNDIRKLVNKKVPIVIRKSVKKQFDQCIFIPHPYMRRYPWPEHYPCDKKVFAVSVSRIDFDKNTTMLLDANRIIKAKKRKIQIHGFENRIYTRFKVCPEYPEWKQSVSHFSREAKAVHEILNDARFMVDLSLIKGDGGGTQYTFLEAWDAGAVPILHEGWIMKGHAMKPHINCLTVKDGAELAQLLNSFPIKLNPSANDQLRMIVKNGERELKKHAPLKIGRAYLRHIFDSYEIN